MYRIERQIVTAHVFLRRLGLGGSFTASFGTLMSFFIRSENFPNPRGFLSGVSLAMLCVLLLDPHEARIANSGEFAVCESLPQHATQRVQEAASVPQLAEVEPEALLVAVAFQVPRSDGDVSPLQRPLEQAEEVLGRVGVNPPANEFTGGVRDNLVAEMFFQSAGCRPLVSVDRCLFGDVPGTGVLSVPPRPVIFFARFLACMFAARPPMKVSSDSISPSSFVKSFDSIALRMRCSMNHAVR